MIQAETVTIFTTNAPLRICGGFSFGVARISVIKSPLTELIVVKVQLNTCPFSGVIIPLIIRNINP